MKIDLPVDREDFKRQVKALREKLNESQINGILAEDFEDQLNKLLRIEKALLYDLIPYYRAYANNIAKTSMQIKLIKQLGALSFDSFLRSALRINEKLFIAGSIDRKIQFFYIDIVDDLYHHNRIKEEWSLPIKEIKETISFIYKLNDREILLLGVRGGCYLLSSDNLEQIPDVNGKIKVRRIQMDYEFNGFGRCLEINDNLFVLEKGQDTLALLELIKENDDYHLTFRKDIYCDIPNWTAFEKIDDNYFVVGTKVGKLYFVKYEHKQLTITEKVYIMDNEIRKIRYLENGDGSKDSLVVVGNKGQLKILSLSKGAKTIKLKLNDIKGDLFDVQSTKGTAVVLSEDGIIYLLEENFGNWHLNKEVTINDAFFTNVLRLDISRYLLMDVEGKLNLLEIDRINTPENLWDLPLYQ